MARGGKRKGAGRPKGTGKFGEPTKAVRIPISMIDRIMEFVEKKGLQYPVYMSKAQAKHDGPSDAIPAQKFNLPDHLVSNPAATFFVRASGDAMIGAGIFDGDLLIADKSLQPKNGDIVVAVVAGEFVVRCFERKAKSIELKPENKKHKTLTFAMDAAPNIWGVVKNGVHSF